MFAALRPDGDPTVGPSRRIALVWRGRTDMDSPTTVAGMPVVAVIKIDSMGLRYPHVVAVTQDTEDLFNVHTAQKVRDAWEAYGGTYRLAWPQALDEAVNRASLLCPTPAPAEAR